MFNWALLVILSGILPCMCLNLSPLYRRMDQSAKNRFCSQKYFDSLSFDGESYKFTVNRKTINPFVHNTFEEFKLKYQANTGEFVYSSSTFDYQQVVKLGGFYIDKLQVYIEFYKNSSQHCQVSKKVSYCPYYEVPKFIRKNCTRSCSQNQLSDSPQTKLNLCDWRFLDEPCKKKGPNGRHQSVRTSIYSETVVEHLKSDKPCAFAYDSTTEKMIYIFSDRDNPFVVNSLRTVSSAPNNHWFIKDIRSYRMNKFVGAFNWPTGANSSTIYLLAKPNWMRNSSVLFQLIDTTAFHIASQPISWKAFFGCETKAGRSQLLQTDAGVTAEHGKGQFFNVFTITILALLALIFGLAAFALARKAKLSAIKRFFRGVVPAV